jgi:hypothetical protein
MKIMPALGTKCVQDFNTTLTLAANTETLWLTAPPARVVRKQLKAVQLEALYEATFLRIFSAYESFLEDSLAHFMAGYSTSTYTPTAAPTATLHRSLKSARAALYGKKRYLLWHDVGTTIKRAQVNISGCPVEMALTGNQSNLEDYASIRHHIAHNSRDSATQFAAAANRLTGSTHRLRPGHLLRAPDIRDPLNQPKWIRTIVDDLATTVLQICP